MARGPATIERMLPRYSLRRLLIVMVVAAGLFGLLSLAVRYNRLWLVGLVAFVVALLVIAAVHALLFLAVWTYTEATRRRDTPPSLPGEPTA